MDVGQSLSISSAPQIPVVSTRKVTISPDFEVINLQTDIAIATRQQEEQALANPNAPPPPRPSADAGAHYYGGAPIELQGTYDGPTRSGTNQGAIGNNVNSQA